MVIHEWDDQASFTGYLACNAVARSNDIIEPQRPLSGIVRGDAVGLSHPRALIVVFPETLSYPFGMMDVWRSGVLVRRWRR
jgi:hypothetical protein